MDMGSNIWQELNCIWHRVKYLSRTMTRSRWNERYFKIHSNSHKSRWFWRIYLMIHHSNSHKSRWFWRIYLMIHHSNSHKSRWFWRIYSWYIIQSHINLGDFEGFISRYIFVLSSWTLRRLIILRALFRTNHSILPLVLRYCKTQSLNSSVPVISDSQIAQTSISNGAAWKPLTFSTIIVHKCTRGAQGMPSSL